jgi:hypothetical protein
MRMESEHRYWFPAKRYGWGWGPPVTWQGWLVMAVFIGLLVASAVAFPPNRAPGIFIICVVALSALLSLVCWLKGEPPRWRWGDDRG